MRAMGLMMVKLGAPSSSLAYHRLAKQTSQAGAWRSQYQPSPCCKVKCPLHCTHPMKAAMSQSDFTLSPSHVGWNALHHSTIVHLCANIGRMSWYLLLVLVSPMAEGASLLPPLCSFETRCQPTEDVQTTLVTSAKQQEDFDFIFKYCQPVSSMFSGSDAGAINPLFMFIDYINNRDGRMLDVYRDHQDFMNLSLLEDAKNGHIVELYEDEFNITIYDERLKRSVNLNVVGFKYFRYDPIVNYDGNDSAVFMFEFEGKRYKVILDLLVEPLTDNWSYERCTTRPELIDLGDSTDLASNF
jgi:hypothetical protein